MGQDLREQRTVENDEDPLTTLFHLYSISNQFLVESLSYQVLNAVIQPLRAEIASLSPHGIRHICEIATPHTGLWNFAVTLAAYILVQKDCAVCGVDELETLFAEFREFQHAVLTILRKSAGVPVDPRTLDAGAFDLLDAEVGESSP